MLGKIWKIVVIISIVAGIAYAGASVYVNFIATQPTQAGQVKMPDIKEAAYSVVIESTGSVMLTANYEVIGAKAGQRVYVLHGYWEIAGQEFRYRNADITLSEKVIGKVSVQRREIANQK